MLALLAVVLLVATLPWVSYGDFSVFVAENQPQAIRLKTKNVVTEGTVLNLPINIPEPVLSFDGKLPPRLKSISCYNSSGFYTIGDDLHIYLEYFSNVVVSGSPAIVLNTGCSSGKCITWEVQSFECRATRGMFSMQLEDEVVMNIDVNTTSERLEQYLRRFSNIQNVSVEIYPGNDNPYNENRVCSDVGNVVNITFYRADFPEYHGDIPPLKLNRYNDNPDALTRLSQGIDTKFLKGTKHGDSVFLSETTTELVKGANRTNAIIPYSYGSGTTNITFIYTVALGDTVDYLDVVNIDFSAGNIASRFGTGVVDQTVPPLGRGYRYMSSSAGSLSSTFTIGISSFLASIVQVTSPNATGIYTAGDELFIDVTFDLSVRVTNSSLIKLTLALSLFSRDATFHDVINEGKTIRFLYDVQVSDAASVLETKGTSALTLNGGKIFVRAGTKDLDAVITLPQPYSSNSLSADKTLTINPNNPIVAYVRVLSPDGNYTAGDSIYLQAVFSTTVYVEGAPRIALSNIPRDLDVDILTAPHLPQLGYRRSYPSGIAQVKLLLSTNVAFVAGDQVILYLPRLNIIDPDVTFRRRMTVDLYGDVAMNMTGFWHDTEKQLILTLNGSVARFENLEILIAGRSSLFVDAWGIGAPYEETITFLAQSLSSTYSLSLPFATVASVGYSNISVAVSPLSFDQAITLTADVTLPEYLSYGDVISLYVGDFVSDASTVDYARGSFSSLSTDFSYEFLKNSSVITATVTGSSNGFKSTSFTWSIPSSLGLRVPNYGLDSNSVSVSLESTKNGNIYDKPVYYVPKVCSAPADGTTGVFYYTYKADANSAVRFTFTSGIFGLVAGDQVVFNLTQLVPSSFPNVAVESSLLYGEHKSSFAVTIVGTKVIFTVSSPISADTLVDITVDQSVGLKTPKRGVQVDNGDTFGFLVSSTLCSMSSARNILYPEEAQIVFVEDSLVHLTPLTDSFGSLTAIGIRIGLASPGLSAGDLMIVTLPGFSRSIDYILFNASNIISNANVTAMFNRRVPRLEITLNEDFSGASGDFTVNVTGDALMFLPTSSLSSSAFQLSIYSSSKGMLRGYTMASQCLGFCSSSIAFSSRFTGESQSIGVSFSYSSAIPVSSAVSLVFRGLDVASTVAVYQDSTAVSYVQSGDLYLNLTLPSAVSAFSTVSLTITGLKLSASAPSYLSAWLLYEDAALSGTASVALACPDVYTKPFFRQSNFTVDTSDVTQFELSFQLAEGHSLYTGNFIDVKLRDFTYSGNDLANDVSDNLGAIAASSSSYLSAQQILRLVLSKALNDTSHLRVTVEGFALPAKGLSANSTVVNYRIGYDASVTGMITQAQAFGTVSEYITISDATVDLFAAANDSTTVEFIRLSFDLTSSLEANEKIYLHLPHVAFSDASASSTVSIGVLGNVGTTAVWDKTNNRIAATLTESSALNIDLVFNTTRSTSDFVVRTSGIPSNTLFTVLAVDAAGDTIANSTGLLPCVGICDITIRALNRNPGRSSAYVLNATFGSVLMNFGDHIDFALDGFGSLRSEESYNITCTSVSSSDEKLFSLLWMSNSSTLRMKYVPQASEYGAELLSSLYCLIPQDFNLQLPQEGIRSTALFTANLTLVNAGVTTHYLADSVQFETVGAPVISVMSISPQQSNVAVSIAFSFIFEDDVTAGDVMNVYLPNFQVPSRSIQVFAPTNVSVRIVGYAASATTGRNPDSSEYVETSVDRLYVQLLSDVAAGTLLEFNFTSDAGVISPKAGLFTIPFPWFSVISDSSPISGVTFQNLTRIGTLSPAALAFTDASNDTTSMYDMQLNFTVFCPLVENDTLYINAPVLDQRSQDAYISILDFNSSRKASVKFASTWINGTTSIAITLKEGYVLSGDLFFRLRFYGFYQSPAVLYPNDNRFFYESSSTICPISTTPFDASPTFFVNSATAALVPIAGGDGRRLHVSFAIKPTVDVLEGDSLAVQLNHVVYDASCTASVCTMSLTATQKKLLSTVQFVQGANTTEMWFTFARNISALNTVRFVTSSLTNATFYTTRYVLGSSDVAYYLLRNTSLATSVNRTQNVVFYGEVQSLSLQPYVLSSSIYIHRPIAGEVSGLTLNCQFSGELTVNDRLLFFLPSFALAAGNPSTWTYVSDDAILQFRVVWEASSKTLQLTPLLRIAALTEISAVIELARGMTLPVTGVPVIGYVITVTLVRSGTTIFRGAISDITNVPYIASSTISFLSCDEQDSYNFGGNTKALQLVPGHELTEYDAGSMISINGTVYFISQVADNVVYLVEEYTGSRVFLGSPDVTVASPPYRYANYINGSGTNTLVFEYSVDRGDKSFYLSIYPSMTSIDLNGGQILRFSMKPKLPSALAISLFQNNFHKLVNTDAPTVVSIYTTSPTGSYGAGQLIDIWLEFSHEVELQQQSPLPVPQVILTVNQTGYSPAKYHVGSGTNKLVFLYEVQSTDEQLVLSADILTESDPIYQPLRIITGNRESALYRKAKAPFLNADLRVTNASFELPSHLRWIGTVARVTSLRVASTSSLGNALYTAGETIDIVVQFSSDVTASSTTSDRDRPYIVLNMGNGRSSNAYYSGAYSSDALLFSYEFTNTDEVSGGLFLTCQCEDFLQRTFLQVNGSSIVSDDSGLPAALLIASSSSVADLLIDASVVVDNVTPYVVSVDTNVTSGIFAPGSAIEIYVTYSAPVMIVGLITLQLRGESTACRAGFFYGNGTETLTFLYHISYQSGVARLECTSADAVDTSLGRVYKLSTVASTAADNRLPNPGAPEALGRVKSMIIDPTPATVRSIEVLHTLPTEDLAGPILATRQLPFTQPQYEYEALFEECGCDALKDSASESESLLRIIGKVDAEYDALNMTAAGNPYHYYRYLLSALYPEGIEALPANLRRCFNWWKSYEVADQLSLSVKFNRPVALKHGVLAVTEDDYITTASSSAHHRSYTLSLRIVEHPAVDKYFLLRSDGVVSTCLPQSVDAGTLRTVLQRMPSVAIYDPIVSNPTTAQNEWIQFVLTFQKAVDLELILGHDANVLCASSSSADDVLLQRNADEVVFNYDIQATDSLVLVVNDTVPAGSYSVNFTGPMLRSWGAEKNSFQVHQLSPYGYFNGTSSTRSTSVSRITLSSLYFDSTAPGADTTFRVEICASTAFAVGDTIEVHFPDFNASNAASVVFASTSTVAAVWVPGNSSVVFTFLASSSCIGEVDTIVDYAIVLRPTGIYRNDPGFAFSVASTTVGDFTHIPFERVSPVGFSRFSIDFNDTRPYQPTELILLFESLLDLEPGNDTLTLYLPRFYAADIKHVDIYIIGSLNGLIEARWSNRSSSLYLSPLVHIPAGSYNFTVQSALYPITVGPWGISTEAPPQLRIDDPHWNMSYTALQSFPLVYGYRKANVEFSVNSSYYVNEVTLHVELTRAVEGPAEIQLVIPGLDDLTGFTFVDGATAVGANFDNATWFNFNHTWRFQSQSGWAADYDLELRVANLSSFKINDIGVLAGLFSGLTFSIRGSTGYVPLSPITVNDSIPIISNGKFSIPTIETDAFAVGATTMTLSFHLNTYPTLQDTFHFKFEGFVLNFTTASIVDPCYNISAWYADATTATTYLGVSLANGSTTCFYRRVRYVYLEFLKVHNDLSDRRIKQYGEKYAWYAWHTPAFRSDFFVFEESVWVGIYSSAVEFLSPYAGRVSDMLVKVLTATQLSDGDFIRLTIPSLQAPWSSATVVDQFNRQWAATFVNASSLLLLEVPTELYASALQFTFKSFVVPSVGVAYNLSSSYAITVSRPTTSLSLQLQTLGFVTPVGTISDGSVRLKRTAVNGIDFIAFALELDTLNPLFAGDEVVLEFSNVVFSHPSELAVEAAWEGFFRVATVSATSVRVVVFTQQLDTHVTVSVQPSAAIAVKNDAVCMDANECTARVDIASFSNPVRDVDISCEGAFLKGGSSITFAYMDRYAPENVTYNASAIAQFNRSASVIGLAFNFSLQQTLPRSGHLILNLDTLLNTTLIDGSETITLSEVSNVSWVASWYNASRVILRPTEAIAAGNQSISLKSLSFAFDQLILLENTAKVTYELYDGTSYSDHNEVQYVGGWGLRTVRHVWADASPNAVSALQVTVEAIDTFLPGDVVFLSLPGVTTSASSLNATADFTGSVSWDNTNQVLTVAVSHGRPSRIHLRIPASTGFQLPSAGVSSMINVPSVAFNRTRRVMYYDYTTLPTYQTFAPNVYANVSFSPRTPFEWATVQLTLTTAGLEVSDKDTLSLSLPQFSSFASALTVVDAGGVANWTATWSSCEERVYIALADAGTSVSFTSLTLDIATIRLPPLGVSASTIRGIAMDVQSSVYDAVPSLVLDVEKVGNVDRSTLAWSPGKLEGTNEALLTLQLSMPLQTGDVVEVKFPGVNVTAPCTATTSSSTAFSVAFRYGNSSMRLTALTAWAAREVIAINTSSCFTLQSSGFPDKSRRVQDYTVSVSTAAHGHVDDLSIDVVPVIGIVSALVTYDVVDIEEPFSLRLDVELSADLKQDDEIYLHVPVMNYTRFDADDSVALTLRGDWVETDFEPFFTGTLAPSDGVITLTCNNSLVQRRRFSVYISMANRIGLGLNVTAPAQISANISDIGAVSKNALAVDPAALSVIRDPVVDIVDCNGRGECQFLLHFDVVQDLPAQAAVVVSSSAWTLPRNNSLQLIGSVAEDLFNGHWRYADNVDGVTIPAQRFVTRADDGYDWTDADLDILPLDLTLPQSLPLPGSAIVTTDIPRVVDFGFVNWTYNSVLPYEDAMLYVEFSQPVAVYTFIQVFPRLLLNTGEAANYWSGSGSTTLFFKYTPYAPTTVASLTLAGSSALELLSSGLIMSTTRANVAANLTISAPFDLYRLDEGYRQRVRVSPTASAEVTSIYEFSRNVTYGSGDVLDIAVTFDRPVVLGGSPELALHYLGGASADGSDRYYGLRFVNVSYTQFVNFERLGDFSFVYGGAMTPCLSSSRPREFVAALSQLSGLQWSLPVSLRRVANDDIAMQFELTFGGIAPSMLTVETAHCSLRATVSVAMDKAMLNHAVFRTEIKANNPTGNLTYFNYTSLTFRNHSADSTSIALAAFQRALNDSLLVPPGTLAKIDNNEPYVLNVSSSFFFEERRAAISGDTVSIEVTFNAPVVPRGEIFLVVAVENLLDAAVRARNVSLTRYVDTRLIFDYVVEMGDVSANLQAERLLTVGNSTVLRSSRVPAIGANLTLPRDARSLADSFVTVNATDLPKIMRIFNMGNETRLTAGMSTLVGVQFSSVVQLVSVNASQWLVPFLPLVSPSGRSLTYKTGGGTSLWVFNYTVRATDTSGAMTLYFTLVGGKGRDVLNQTFANLSATTLYEVADLYVNTVPPYVVKVDCNCDDGTYYPGQVLDVFVEFNEPILIVPTSLSTAWPQLEIFTFTQYGENVLANYWYGNGTNQLHFRYVVPPPNINALPHLPFGMNYAGVLALRSYLHGCILTSVSPSPETLVNDLLPTMDVSFLVYHREIYLNLAWSRIDSVSLARRGVYTVGDVVTVRVNFTSPVMFFHPAPYFLLHLDTSNVTATYSHGNGTKTLWFTYTVKAGDAAQVLDYVQTDYPPYRSDILDFSFPLIAYDDFNAKAYGKVQIGLFMLSDSARYGVPVPFPLPGAAGSISNTTLASVDTTIPRIFLVTTLEPSGTYGYPQVLTVFVTFSWPVVVAGCPRLVFVVQGVVKYATYAGGSGTDTLRFHFVIAKTDYKLRFDYESPYSFELMPCTGSYLDESLTYIRRLSDVPTLNANLTMPHVNYRPTITSPSSILASGVDITLAGDTAVATRVTTPAAGQTAFSFGDAVQLRIVFSADVSVQEPYNWLEVGSAAKPGVLYKDALYVNQTAANTLQFCLVPSPYDVQRSLTYLSTISLKVARTLSSCAFVQADGACVAQNLPRPDTQSLALSLPASTGDELTPKNISVKSSRSRVRLEALDFATPPGKAYFASGDAVKVLATFSEAVAVVGQPLLEITINDSYRFSAAFEKQVSASQLQFSRVVGLGSLSGVLQCGRLCQIDTKNGRILRRANFLPVVSADLSIPDKRCYDESCSQIESVLYAAVPEVTRVFSNASGVQTLNDTIFVFVEFSAPVKVAGAPQLLLNLPQYPAARFLSIGYFVGGAFTAQKDNVASNVVAFRYKVRPIDRTSALEYASVDALVVLDGSLNAVNVSASRLGIFAASDYSDEHVSYQLPVPGSDTSLGVTSAVVIDQSRPNVVAITTSPTSSSTCGDVLVVSLVYNQPMIFVSTVSPALNTPPQTQVKLRLSLVLPTTGAVLQSLNASFSNLTDNVLTFRLLITSQFPVGKIVLASKAPLILGSYSLVSKFTRVTSPVVLDDSVVGAFGVAVVRNLPVVLSVSSPNTTTSYSYGVGDVLYIEVLFNVPVRVDGGNATLTLSLDGVERTATFHQLKAGNTIIEFTYTVEGDDRTERLSYAGTTALQGKIYQISRCDAPVPADRTLPVPGSPDSLSGCCPISIDSTPPFIRAVFPVKAQGVYGENEPLLVVVRFSTPVVVQGYPTLLLQVGDNRTAAANYTPRATVTGMFRDLTVDLLTTDVPFVYYIDADDAIDSVVHAGVGSLLVGGAYGRILQLSDNPAFDADTTLRDPSDLTQEAGSVSRQWKHRFFQSVEVLLRDVQHTNPAALTMSLNHLGTNGVIFQGCCQEALSNPQPRVFGYSKNYYTAGTVSSVLADETGQGEDLVFSDSMAPNIAVLQGKATQSSTIRAASLAIDGGYSPVVGDGSVSETVQGTDPWWHLSFTSTSTPVQSIAIYERLPQVWVQAVVQFTIKGLDRKPSGYFRLRFSNINADNATETVTTRFIKIGAEAENVLKAIVPLSELGNVQVEKRDLPLCVVEGRPETYGGGCGNGVDYGYGAAYKLTFLSLLVAEPVVQIVDLKYPGEPLQTNGTATTSDTAYLAQRYPISLKVKRLRSGYYKPVFKQYQGDEPGEDTSLTNEWLTPFYVYLFNATVSGNVPTNITLAKQAAVWYQYVTSIDKVRIITLPQAYNVASLRIQREGTGQLSLAEVAVYSTALRGLEYYDRGSPVQSSELGAVYNPATPIRPVYAELPYDGLWVVTITQGASGWTVKDGVEPKGSLSEAVIVVTDMAGVVTAYYQDIYAVIETLPRYGTLFTTDAGSVLGYKSWHEAFGLVYSQPVLADAARSIHLGQCAADPHGQCFQNVPGSRDFRVELTQQVTGSKPSLKTVLRSERIVFYVPDPRFQGQDFFTYSTYVSSELRQADQTVTMVVQPCRLFLNRTTAFGSRVDVVASSTEEDPTTSLAPLYSGGDYWNIVSNGLCTCAPSPLAIVADEEACAAARVSLCKTAAFRSHFYDMCLSCYGYSLTGAALQSNYRSNDAANCRAQTIKAASLLLLRGLCTSTTGNITSAAVGRSQLNTNGTTTYDAYYASRGVAPGEQAIIPDECLVPQTEVSASTILRRNYISAQQPLPSRD